MQELRIRTSRTGWFKAVQRAHRQATRDCDRQAAYLSALARTDLFGDERLYFVICAPHWAVGLELEPVELDPKAFEKTKVLLGVHESGTIALAEGDRAAPDYGALFGHVKSNLGEAETVELLPLSASDDRSLGKNAYNLSRILEAPVPVRRLELVLELLGKLGNGLTAHVHHRDRRVPVLIETEDTTVKAKHFGLIMPILD